MRATPFLCCLFLLALLGGCRSYDSALLDAIRKQEVGNVQRLLAGGGDANEVPDGETQFPIEAAAIGGSPEIVGMLLKAGASPDSSRGEASPLWLAIEHDHAAAAAALVRAGARVDGPVRKGMTPLYAAVLLDDFQLVKRMLDAGASAVGPGPLGSPFHAAADNGNLPVMHILLEGGAALDAPNDLGETPLYLAGLDSNWEAVAWLAARGAALSATNALGNTLLHAFAEKSDTAAIQRLCALGIDPDVQNKIGQTALHVAAAKGDLETVVALIDHCRPDLNLRDIHGLSPAGLAYNAGEDDVVDLLTAKGGRLR